MAKCEYRLSPDDAEDNLVDTIKGKNPRSPVGVIVVSKEPVLLCQVKINHGEIMPTCDLENMSGEDCPIAKFNRREIDFTTANQLLRKLFSQE